MTYIRIIPRDLFNEASLLKCLGHLYICLETAGEHSANFDVEDVVAFDIQQNEDDGSIFVANIPFTIEGKTYHLFRPLNSRAPWPLWLSDTSSFDFDPIKVFNDDGSLSEDMRAIILVENQRLRFMMQARALPDDEIRRHAWVATANGPFDEGDDSFTTCCELVRREKRLPPLHEE